MLRYQITASSPAQFKSQQSFQQQDFELKTLVSHNTLIKEEEPDLQSSGRGQASASSSKSASLQNKLLAERVRGTGSHDSHQNFDTALDCYLSIDTSKSRHQTLQNGVSTSEG